MVTALGWTFDQVGRCSFRDALDLIDYWEKCPPVHLLLKGFTGYKGPADKNKPSDVEQKVLMGMPKIAVNQMEDWHRAAIERVLKEQQDKKGQSGNGRR